MNPKDKRTIVDKIKNDEDYIYCPRLNNSLKSFVNTHPDSVDEERIAKVLLIDVNEVKAIFNNAIKKIRKKLKLNN